MSAPPPLLLRSLRMAVNLKLVVRTVARTVAGIGWIVTIKLQRLSKDVRRCMADMLFELQATRLDGHTLVLTEARRDRMDICRSAVAPICSTPDSRIRCSVKLCGLSHF